MKRLLTLLLLFTVGMVSAQTPTQYVLRYDTVKVEKSTGNGNAEFVLKNGTRTVKGFLKNIGNGRSVWEMVTIPDVQNLQTSLDALKNRANHTGTQAASTIVQDAGNRFVSDAEKAAWNAKVAVETDPVFISQKGAVNGVATLNSTGKIPNSQIPALALVDTYVAGSQAAMLALSTAEQGDVCIRTDLSKTFVLTDNSYGTLASWKELLTPVIPAESDPVWSSEKGSYATSSWVNGQLGNFYTKLVSDSRYLGVNATAVNSAKWGNQLYSSIATSAPTVLLGYEGSETWKPVTASTVRTFLGLGSAAYQNASSSISGTTGNTVVQRDASNNIYGAYFVTSAGVETSQPLDIAGFSSAGTEGAIRRFSLSYLKSALNETLQSVTDRGATSNKTLFVTGQNRSLGNPTVKSLGLQCAASGAEVFGYDYSAGVGLNLILNQYGGNVGIGTATPAVKLTVAGTGSFTGTVSVATPTASNHATTKDYVDNAINTGSRKRVKVEDQEFYTGSSVHIYPGSVEVSGNNRFSVLFGGSLQFYEQTGVGALGMALSSDVVTGAAKSIKLPDASGKSAVINTTAPASSTATGVVGEIRVTSTYIYVCTAPNTWVRAAVSSW